MGKAEHCTACDVRPAALFIAGPVGIVALMEFSLTEVKCFTWMDLLADTRHEVLIWDLAILVSIKPVEYDLLLILRYRETPVF